MLKTLINKLIKDKLLLKRKLSCGVGYHCKNITKLGNIFENLIQFKMTAWCGDKVDNFRLFFMSILYHIIETRAKSFNRYCYIHDQTQENQLNLTVFINNKNKNCLKFLRNLVLVLGETLS